MKRLLMTTIAAIALVACSGDLGDDTESEQTDDVTEELTGARRVYTASNSSAGNRIHTYAITAEGELLTRGTWSTVGRGTSGFLGNQGGMALAKNGQFILGVNAGSNDFSSMRIRSDGSLQFVDRIGSGGTRPISVTTRGSLAYVLNAGGTGNITGFRVDDSGMLSRISGSTRSLSSASSAPAQVGFSPDGKWLVVTELATTTVNTYAVGTNGLASGPTVNRSSGLSPFGFAFTSDGTLVVSEAFADRANASAVSSYAIRSDGTLRVLSGSVRTNQSAACWVAIPPSSRYAYVTNTASGSISRFSIREGRLTLVSTLRTGTGSLPVDLTFSPTGAALFVHLAGTNRIASYSVGSTTGALSRVDTIAVPPTANGIVAR